MELERFEQLLSDWLDEPQREDLLAQVNALAAESEVLRAAHAQWKRLHELLCRAGDLTSGVKWPRLHERVLAAVADDVSADIQIDHVFQALPSLERRIDWPKLQARFCAAVAADTADVDSALAMLAPIDGRINWGRFRARVRDGVRESIASGVFVPRPTRQRRILRLVTATALAAAAALAFLLWRPAVITPTTRTIQPEVVQFPVQPAEPDDSVALAAGTPVVRLTVVREVDVTADAALALADAESGLAAEAVDVFLMIEPPAVAVASSLELLGF